MKREFTGGNRIAAATARKVARQVHAGIPIREVAARYRLRPDNVVRIMRELGQGG